MNDDEIRRFLRQGTRAPRRRVDLAHIRRRGLRRRASVVGGGATLALALAAAVIVSLPPTGEVMVFPQPASDSGSPRQGVRSEPPNETEEPPKEAVLAPHDPAIETAPADPPSPEPEEPAFAQFQITATVDVVDATPPVPFTVDVTDPGVVTTTAEGGHEVGFTSTDGTVYLDDPRFTHDLRDGEGRLRTAGRGCDAAIGFCNDDLQLLRTDEGERTPTTVKLYAGELAPGTYVLQQPVAWSSWDGDIWEVDWTGNYPERREPDGRATVRIAYEVTHA